MNMNRNRLLVPLLAMAMSASIAQAQEAPAAAASAPADSPARIDYPSVAAARTALEALDGQGTVVTHPEGWTIVNDHLSSAQWSFTPEGYYAYPAVVRRSIKRSGGKPVAVETVSLCEAEAQACAKLLVEFEGLNDRITQAIRARGRQGSTQPQR